MSQTLETCRKQDKTRREERTAEAGRAEDRGEIVYLFLSIHQIMIKNEPNYCFSIHDQDGSFSFAFLIYDNKFSARNGPMNRSNNLYIYIVG